VTCDKYGLFEFSVKTENMIEI